MEAFVRMLRCSSGASAAEYALLIAIVGGALALAGFTLGSAVAGAMSDASDCIASGTSTSC